MKEDIISFETATIADQIGFDSIYINKCYNQDKKLLNKGFRLNWNKAKGYNEKYYSAPTQSLLQKWLREKYNVYANPIPNFKNDIGEHHAGIVLLRNDNVIDTVILKDKRGLNKIFISFEESLEEVLKESCKIVFKNIHDNKD